MNHLPRNTKHPEYNAEMKCHNKIYKLYAYDMLGKIEFYDKSPWEIGSLPIGVGDKTINIFYSSNRPKFKNYIIRLTKAAYYENEPDTQYKKGMIFTKFRAKFIPEIIPDQTL